MSPTNPANAEVDQLFDVKNSFYVGNYQQAINYAEKIKKSSLEKDIFMYRAYLASNRHRVVLDEISSSDRTDLLALRYLAEYFNDRSQFENLIKKFEDCLAKANDSNTESAHVIWTIAAACLYINEGLYEDALRLLHGVDDLECMAMQIYIFLQMNRLDLAKKTHQQMQEKDEDATLTQLAQAWINIEMGGEKLQDAFYIFDDFNDKFTSSVLLLNNMAVCALGQHKFDDDVHNYLRDGLDREPNNPDLLTNFIFYTQQADKNPEPVVNRYLTLLKDTSKNCELIRELEKKEAEFDRLCLSYGLPEETA
jgi:hypothetical protein